MFIITKYEVSRKADVDSGSSGTKSDNQFLCCMTPMQSIHTHLQHLNFTKLLKCHYTAAHNFFCASQVAQNTSYECVNMVQILLHRDQLHFNCEHIDDTNMLSLSLSLC